LVHTGYSWTILRLVRIEREVTVDTKVITLGAAAAVLILTSCAAGPAKPTTPTAGPASATSMAGSPTTPSKSTRSPSPTAREVSESDFCHAVLAHTRPAQAAIKKLAKHPDGQGVTVEDFRAPRDKLAADERQAPKHLKKYLHTEVGVLDAILRNLTTGGQKHIKTQEFGEAKVEFILDCEMVE
jgi:hypothetical protein